MHFRSNRFTFEQIPPPPPLLHHTVRCYTLHRCTLSPSPSPTQEHTVFGGRRIMENWDLKIDSLNTQFYGRRRVIAVSKKYTVYFTRRVFSCRECTCEISRGCAIFVLFNLKFVVIARKTEMGWEVILCTKRPHTNPQYFVPQM